MPIAISVNMLRLRVTQRLPAAHEERPARPQHDRRRERELDPVRQRLIDRSRARRRCARPSPARTPAASARAPIQKRRVMSAVRDWARCRRSRSRAPAPCRRSGRSPGRPAGSRMHRAGVDRAFRHRLGGARALVEIFRRIGGEFGAAAGRAEIIGVALDARGGAWRCADRPSCRRQDRRTAPPAVRVTVIVRDVIRVRHTCVLLETDTPGGI